MNANNYFLNALYFLITQYYTSYPLLHFTAYKRAIYRLLSPHTTHCPHGLKSKIVTKTKNFHSIQGYFARIYNC